MNHLIFQFSDCEMRNNEKRAYYRRKVSIIYDSIWPLFSVPSSLKAIPYAIDLVKLSRSRVSVLEVRSMCAQSTRREAPKKVASKIILHKLGKR